MTGFSGQTNALIGSSWTSTGQTFEVINPFSGKVVANVADCGVPEAQAAVEASVAAFETWRDTTAYERATLLRKW